MVGTPTIDPGLLDGTMSAPGKESTATPRASFADSFLVSNGKARATIEMFGSLSFSLSLSHLCFFCFCSPATWEWPLWGVSFRVVLNDEHGFNYSAVQRHSWDSPLVPWSLDETKVTDSAEQRVDWHHSPRLVDRSFTAHQPKPGRQQLYGDYSNGNHPA